MANLKGMIANRMGLGDAFGDVVSPLSKPPNPCPPTSASKTTSQPKQSPTTEAPNGDETAEVEEGKEKGVPENESQDVLEATPKDEVEDTEVPTKTVGRGRGRGRGRGGGRGVSLKRPAASSAPSPSTFKRPAAASAQPAAPAPPATPPAEEVVENDSGANGGKNPGTLLATHGNWQAWFQQLVHLVIAFFPILQCHAMYLTLIALNFTT